MSISSEITRIKNNIVNAYTNCNLKGATMPTIQNSNNLAETINSIETLNLQEKIITPTTSVQEVVADNVYNGLSKVTVEGIVIEEKTISLDFSNSDVNEVIPTEGKYLQKVTINKDANKIPENIAKGVIIDGIEGTLESGGEYNATIDTSSKNKVIAQMISSLPTIDLTNWTSAYQLFYTCEKIKEIPDLVNTSTVTNMAYMFGTCRLITTIPEIDTSNVTYAYGMFFGCNSILSIPKLNFGKVISISNMFSGCGNLRNIENIIDLGKAYTQKSNNYNNYKLDLSVCSNLTRESLINIINNLYDLNLTYDVANGGTLYTQQLVLGGNNKAKLTSAEIAIATNKGWTVS